MEGDEKAQDDFDKWDRFIQNHPDHLKAKEEEAKAWIEKNKIPNEEACKKMKSFIPPDIFKSNVNELKKQVRGSKAITAHTTTALPRTNNRSRACSPISVPSCRKNWP